MTERWIFGFRQTGRRELADSERDEYRRRARQATLTSYLRGLVAVMNFGFTFMGVAIGSEGNVWGWALVVIGITAFFWALSWANDAGRLSLLFRRMARVGAVDQYERHERSPEIRARFRQQSVESEDEDDPTQPSMAWDADERFEEKIAKRFGSNPDYLETPVHDGVLIMVGDKIVDRVIDVPILDV